MAFSNIFGAKKPLIKVKSYSINQAQFLGSGAFGIVFKGSDAKKNTIAAKRIDGDKHPRVLTQDLDRILQLDHPNVMKILDVEKQSRTIWLMMPFCELGDLNHLYKVSDVSNDTKINGMKQIAAGISYLHIQNVIHRDIKPGNILVASEIPLRLLLADFDVCKCLDPEVETSLMTSNVGTLAFKAPEFFQRTSPGKIEYHRNVDIYAAGLTFLAMLQAEKGKQLIPHIETPREDSELHAPSIGQLIAERIKYKVPELSIVKIEGEQEILKWLISQMTCVNPEERLSAAKVLEILNQECVATDYEIKKIKLIREKTFSFFVSTSMDVTDNDLLLVRKKEESKYWIQVLHRLTGDLINEIPSMCDHIVRISKYPRDQDYVFESCLTCEEIYAHNINTGESFSVHKGSKIARVFDGPDGSLLVTNKDGQLHKLEWNKAQDGAQSVFVQDIPPRPGKTPLRNCYVERHDILIYTVKDEEVDQGYEIIAVKLGSDTIVWRLSGPVDGHIIKPVAITCDPEGNTYVSDRATNRILKINSLTGEVLSILLFEEVIVIYSMRWSNMEPNLTLRGGGQIRTYFVPK